MKTVLSWSLCSLYAAGIGFAALFFADGCMPVAGDPEPLDPELAFQYDVDPLLKVTADTAFEHLNKASGLGFEHVEGGTVVLLDADLGGDCAQTIVSFDPSSDITTNVYIALAFPPPAGCYQDLWKTLEHELIHSVRRDMDHGTVVHSETGIFQRSANGYDDKLNADSLTNLCEATQCPIFNPEQ